MIFSVRTVVTLGSKQPSRLVQSPNNGRVWLYDTVVPHNSDAKFAREIVGPPWKWLDFVVQQLWLES
jgi:hypothetical protein